MTVVAIAVVFIYYLRFALYSIPISLFVFIGLNSINSALFYVVCDGSEYRICIGILYISV